VSDSSRDGLGGRATLLLALTLSCALPALAQQASALSISGRVVEQSTGAAIPAATVTIEERDARALTDSAGRFTFRALAPGAITIRAQRLGFAPARTAIVLLDRDATDVVISLVHNPLALREVTVTADRNRQVHGELGTGSVIDREAIRNLGAASLAGVLELIPGAVLQPPGLDAGLQVSLRAIPISPTTGSLGAGTAPRRSAEQLAAFGTQVIVDDVPVSNNANLQSLGPRAELSISSTAGGGVDLRRIPAATLERVEVIRGIASARYGDLTSGVVLVETRAGAVPPDIQVRSDPHTLEATSVGGARVFDGTQAFSVSANAARTRVAPGLSEDQTQRFTLQIAHRLELGTSERDASLARGGRELTADTRLDIVVLEEDNPETPTLPGSSSFSHDRGFRLTHRFRRRTATSTFSLTAGFDHLEQNSYTQSLLLRGAAPFTAALDSGQHIGKFIGGQYLSKVTVDGAPSFEYVRAEARFRGTHDAIGDETVVGTELRSEWSSGAGLQFDPEFPPSTTFDGINGYERPRRYDDVGRLGLGALYVDRTWRGRVLGEVVEAQGGIRLDGLFTGTGMIGRERDAVLSPRLNIIVRPTRALALRAGVGRFAKSPALLDLSPGLQYTDVVNVNYYANNPAERLAVFTTSIYDRTNPSLGFATLDRDEVGADVSFADGQGALSVVAYTDALTHGVGLAERYVAVLRNRYALGGPPMGSGQPPTVLQPPIAVDTLPALIDTPRNDITSKGRGVEVIAAFPEIAPLRLRIEAQAQYASNRVRTDDIEFGNTFTLFQETTQPRTPFWDPSWHDGDRMLVTTRLVHHQPAVGLVVTGTVQLFLRQTQHDEAGTDTLSWAGYIGRQGHLTRVPAADRTQPQYADLRLSRTGFLIASTTAPAEWLMNLQIAKSLGDRGRFTFYAFNALDRIGRYGNGATPPILHPASRFGVELSLPLSP
jgi:hypothetical protein